MDAAPHAMKSMKLYAKVERICNELRARGIDDEAPLTVDDLTAFDQYHYHGTDAVDAAITAMDIGPASHVLEIGAGIGGPARYLAARTGCRVTALELQPDLDAVGRMLTERCSLAQRVHHVCGDVLQAPLAGGDFAAIVSFLVFLHIPARRHLFQTCRAALRPGGRMYVEDFTKLNEPSAAQWQDLRHKVQCPYLPTAEEYRAQIVDAGFEDIVLEDLTDSWAAFTAERHRAFRARRAHNVKIHGLEITDGLEDFYRTVADLYAKGALGGLRVVAARPRDAT